MRLFCPYWSRIHDRGSEFSAVCEVNRIPDDGTTHKKNNADTDLQLTVKVEQDWGIVDTPKLTGCERFIV